MQRVYIYSDESGTKGQEVGLFAVAGVAISAHANVIKEKLLRAEKESRKGRAKWQKTKDPKVRRLYLREVLKIEQLKGCAFCRVYERGANPFAATVETLQLAAQQFGGGRQCVLIHQGFNYRTRNKLRDQIRHSASEDITVEAGNMENEPRVRLADALAGFSWLVYSNSPALDLFNDLPYAGWFRNLE